MKIFLNQDLCQGHGQCELIAPGYFEIREDAKAYLLKDTFPASDVEVLEEAAMRCPVLAISIPN